jgi:membrane protease YdiL (CAAX protease family)
VRKWIGEHQLVAFFLIAFAFSWMVWIPAINFLVIDDDWHPVMYVGAFGPWLSAILVVWATVGGGGVRGWFRQRFGKRINPLWYVTAWFLMPIGVGAFQYLLHRLAGGEPARAGAGVWIEYAISVPIGALIAGGNEEPGWRGFALPRMLESMGPVAASLALGAFWVAWHIPLFWLEGWSGADQNFLLFLLSVGGLSIIMTWLFYKSSMNVIPAMLFHQATNQVQAVFPTPGDLIPGVDDWQILRGAVYWAIAIVLIAATRGRLGYSGSNDIARGGSTHE